MRSTVTKKSLKLIHYGSPRYLSRLFKPIKDKHWIKPDGGLWTTPVDSEYGWNRWCAESNFGDCRKCFGLKFFGTVVTVDKVKDLDQFQWEELLPGFEFPLFEPLLKAGVDAIHLTAEGQWRTRLSFPRNFYGWDCESVLILNKKSITPVRLSELRQARSRQISRNT
jgi:hypothetical protein